MVKNLSQLKKTLKNGTRFVVTAHCRPEYVGQKRRVTLANTQGFYSVVPEEPDCKVTLANNGKGTVLWWSNAPFWEFDDETCSVYCSDQEHTEKFLIMSFRITEQEAVKEGLK